MSFLEPKNWTQKKGKLIYDVTGQDIPVALIISSTPLVKGKYRAATLLDAAVKRLERIENQDTPSVKAMVFVNKFRAVVGISEYSRWILTPAKGFKIKGKKK